MNPAAKIISIRYGDSVLKNEAAARKLSQSHSMELPGRERLNASFNSEWVDFVNDFPTAEAYLRTDFVDRVFPTFKESVLVKEYADNESVSDVSSDDGIHQILSPRRQRSPKDDSYPIPCNVAPGAASKTFSVKTTTTTKTPASRMM